MKFYYYVTYIITNPHVNLGSANIELDYEINTFEDLWEVRKIIGKEFCNGREPMIINWKRMQK